MQSISGISLSFYWFMRLSKITTTLHITYVPVLHTIAPKLAACQFLLTYAYTQLYTADCWYRLPKVNQIRIKLFEYHNAEISRFLLMKGQTNMINMKQKYIFLCMKQGVIVYFWDVPSGW